MHFVTWVPELELNIAQVDAEHKGLIDDYNTLSTLVRAEIRGERAQDALRSLSSHTLEHFKNEELFMEAAGYPGLRRHQRLHAGLIREITDSTLYYQTTQLIIPLRTMITIKDWLVNHMLEDDALFGVWFQQRAQLRKTS